MLHKIILRAVMKWMATEFKLHIGRELSKRGTKGTMKKYNRNHISFEDFRNWVVSFTSEFLEKNNFLRLIYGGENDNLEFYVGIMVDKKLAKEFYRQKEQKEAFKMFYSQINTYTQRGFSEMLNIPELKMIFNILLKGECIQKIFESTPSILKEPMKFKEALSKLLENSFKDN